MNNGRPRSGVVWDCWKGVKKLFRQNSRFFVNNLSQRKYMRLNNMFHSHNHLITFWGLIILCGVCVSRVYF